uniref:ATP synthase subunit delta, chloroplastic n=1 Tax=Alsidium seaforthii TaxID=2007182 RepID=A0A1Z1MDI5_9FLOR|nr:ATP synthase CF1 subunit delta [Bryothamnion seaforthii]ARW63932.1 ATP synthase CF1 subunit delta [Bryothamnion seaforthii]
MSNQNLKEKIALPYAEALIDIAQKLGLLSETNNNLSSISMVLSQSKDLKLFLSNPLISKVVKKEVLKKLFQDQVNDFILNFLLVLVDRQRISFITTIIEKYLELSYQLESITIAEVSSAVELNESQQDSLIEKIQVITGTNRVKLVINNDPDLIGGFIIKIGSKIIDASLSGKLKNISFYLNTN